MPKLQLDGVTVVDTRTGDRTPSRSILIDQGRITSVAATADVPADLPAQRVDATGKFAVPGFNDMHVHARWERGVIITRQARGTFVKPGR